MMQATRNLVLCVAVALVGAGPVAFAAAQASRTPDGKTCFDVMKSYAMAPGPVRPDGFRVQFTTQRHAGGYPGSDLRPRLDILDAANQPRGFVLLARDQRSLSFRKLDGTALATVHLTCEVRKILSADRTMEGAMEAVLWGSSLCEGASIGMFNDCVVERLE